jgi:hypothetical protein
MRSRVLSAARGGWVVVALALLSIEARGGELVERVLAVVGGRALYLSDVRTLQRLDSVDRETALGRLVDETLLFQEAFRLPQAALSESEERVVAAAAEGDPSICRALHRRAVVRKYVYFRFRPQVRVEQETVHRAYQEEIAGLDDPPPFAAVEDELRERLTAREVEGRVADWVRDLRAAAAVRYNPPAPD